MVYNYKSLSKGTEANNSGAFCLFVIVEGLGEARLQFFGQTWCRIFVCLTLVCLN